MSSNDKKTSILNLVNGAKPTTNKGKINQSYYIEDGTMWILLQDRSGNFIPTALTINFSVLITEQQMFDDGLKLETKFVLEGKNKNGHILPIVTINAKQFASMAWTWEHYGGLGMLSANQATPRLLSVGIVLLSGNFPLVTVYQHTGWRFLNNEWCYLSASGALGATGLDQSIRVDLGAGRLNLYSLPEPNKEPRQVARILFDFLTISKDKPSLGVSLFCCVCRAVLGELSPIDFSLFLSGLTGSGKTESAAIAQSCFGDFNSRNLPASFKDTEGALELKTHRAKDAFLVVDDLKPGTSRKEQDSKIAKFDYLVTASADQMARSRLNPDASEKAAYYTRCMVVITGEIIPDKSASTLGRVVVIEVKRDDVDWSYMTTLQDMAAQSRYSEALSAFIQWLAPQIQELKRTFRKKLQTTRDEALQSQDKFAKSHPRAADIYASMKCASDLYIDFAIQVGAIGHVTAQEYTDTIDSALKSAIRAQAQFQKDSDEVEVFIDLLRSCFKGGECFVSNYQTQGPPLFHPFVWGWRSQTDSHYNAPDQNLNEESKQKIDVLGLSGQGQSIGWIKQIRAKNDYEKEDLTASELWLDPNAAYKVVQRFAMQQNNPLLMNKSTLFRRLLESGKLVKFETDKNGNKRYDPKTPIKIAGSKPRVLMIYSALILDAWGDDV